MDGVYPANPILQLVLGLFLIFFPLVILAALFFGLARQTSSPEQTERRESNADLDQAMAQLVKLYEERRGALTGEEKTALVERLSEIQTTLMSDRTSPKTQ